jgi:hypothetical protein
MPTEESHEAERVEHDVKGARRGISFAGRERARVGERRGPSCGLGVRASEGARAESEP